MKNLESLTVREIALEAPMSTRVFEQYGIDYCCGGRKSLAEACAEAGASTDQVEERLREVFSEGDRTGYERFDRYSVSGLVDHILEAHHEFTKREINGLTPLMEKVAARHGPNHGSLYELKELVFDLFSELTPHMEKEEVILFPYLKDLDEAGVGGPKMSMAFGSVNNPIAVMTAEHDRAGELLKTMRSVTDGYLLPADACPSFAALFTRLEHFEQDIHQHIHLENNLLFPRAVELERRVFTGAAV